MVQEKRFKGGESVSCTSAFQPPHSQKPDLPLHVQASLTSMGMRVRKAIRDGYQTGKKNVSVTTAPSFGGFMTPTGPSLTPSHTTHAVSHPQAAVPQIRVTESVSKTSSSVSLPSQANAPKTSPSGVKRQREITDFFSSH